MSKKRDDIFLDDDFGMDDFGDDGEGGFESPGKKGGRQPVTSLKGSFIEGVKDGIKDPSIQMKFVRAALPSGYNQTIDFADKVASGVNELYTDAAKEAAPVIKTLKEFTRKHVSPGMGDMLPKSWKEKLDSWAEEQESNSREVIDPEESEIAMTLGTMFQAQQEAIQKIDQAQQEREVEREGRQMADANVMQTQTDASLKTLAQIQQNTGRLANYQDQVTINFQRKSLELQYRTYFVNRKLLDVMEQHLDLSKSSFETLVHNSGLPDLLKAHNHEKMVEVMKMKYLGEMTDPMSKWFAGIGTKLIQKGKRDVKDFFQSFGSTLSDMAMGMDSFKEQQEMNREMGEREESMGEFGAKMMGSMAADKGSEWAGKLFGKSDFLRNSRFGQFLEKTGFMLERLNRDKAYMYQDFVNNGEMNGGFLGNIARWFKEGSGTYSRDDRVLSNSADELDKQVYWSLQNSRTLNEVIPGLLTTINQSIIDSGNIHKAGASKAVLASAEKMTKDNKGNRLHYSFESNRFETETDILERVKKELNKPDRDKGLAEALTDVVNAIDEDYDLSEEIRNGIRAYVIELAANAVEMPRVDRWLVEAGDNFPEAIRGTKTRTTGTHNDDDDHLGADGTWVKAISDVVKSTFGYKERVEWKDDKPIGKFSEAFQIFNRQPALNKLSIRYANLVSKLESNKEPLIKFSKQGFGYQEVLRQNKYLVREQEKYKDAFGVEKSKDKSDAFDWRENIEGRNKNILNISRDDAETRAEKDYNRAMEAYKTAKEAYDEGLRTGMVAPGTAAPVEPAKPPHMRAAGGIIPDDGIDRFQLGGKKGKGSKKSQVKWKRQNGYVAGQGTGTSDEIPSYLSNGEYVVRAASVKRPGVMQLLRYINSLGDDDSVWGSSGVGESGDGFALNEAILAAGDKTEAQLVEVNNRLQKLIDKPFVALNFGDLTGPDLEKFKEMFGNMGTGMLSASDKLLLKGKEGVSKASSWLWDKAKWGADKTWGGITGTAKFGWDVASGAVKGTKKIFNDWMEDARDIMVRGSNEVRIRADDIRNRLLYDVNTNEIIKSIKDITGEVRRIDTDEIVLSLEDFRKRLTDQRFKPMLTWVSKKYDQAKNIVFAPFRLVKSIGMHIGNIIDMPGDIYVKGDDPWTPRLRAHMFRARMYRDAKTGQVIDFVSQIKGAVLDSEDPPNTVITDEEFKEGKLVDIEGNPIKGIKDRIYGSIKKAGSFIIDVAKKGLEKVKDFGGWIWDKLSGGWDGFKSWFDGTGTIQLGLFTTQTATVTRLEQIWMLLNDRLPGEKAAVPSDYGKMAELRLPNLGENFKSAEAWFERKKAHIEAKSAIAKAKALAKAEEAKAKLEQLKAEAILKAERARMAKDRIVTGVNAKYGDKMSPFWKRLLGVDKATANQNHFTEWAKAGGFNDNDLKDPEMRGLIEDEYRQTHPDQGINWKLPETKGVLGGIKSFGKNLWNAAGGKDAGFYDWLKEKGIKPEDIDSQNTYNYLRKNYDEEMKAKDPYYERNKGMWFHPSNLNLKSIYSDPKQALNAGRAFLEETSGRLFKRKDEWLQVASERSNNILDMLPAFKPKTFAEWLDSYEISGNDFDKLSPNDRALVETQYKLYVQSVAAKRDELKGKIGFAKTGVMGKFEKIRSFFGKDEDGKSFKDRMNDLKGKIDTFSSDIKTGERRNKLAAKRDSLKEGAKGWLETGKGLKDSVLGAGGSVRDKFKNLIRRRPNADDFVGPVQPMAQAMTFAKFLDSKGINEQEFDYLPDREKEALNKEFQDHHAARGRQIPNLRPDAPKQSLFGKIKGWGGKLKVSNPFKRGQSADADGDGDRDGSAADQRQQRDAKEEKGRFKTLLGKLDEWSSFGKSARDKANASSMDKFKATMDFLRSPKKLADFAKTFVSSIGAIVGGLATSDIKTGEWRNKLAAKRDSLKEGAKGWLETGKGLKDSVIGAGGSVRDKFKNLIRRRPNADDFVGPIQPMAQSMTFAKFLDSKGINEQEFDYLPDEEKEALNKEFQDYHAARGRQIPNLRPDAPKQSLLDKMKGMRGKFKFSNPFKRSQSSDADGDGDRDGSAADQRQQREAAEEKSMMKKFFSGIAGAAKGGWEAGKGRGGIGMLTGLVGLVPKLFTGIAGGIGLIAKAGKALLMMDAAKLMKPVAMAAKAAFGAGSMALRAGIAAASFGASILTAPVVIAAGATAVAAFFGFKWFKSKFQNNDVLFRFRMLQYGFKHDDEENVAKILQTEKALQAIVKFDQQGLASLSGGMKAETLMALWGIDTADPKEVERWIAWFSGRFKPIFLTHCTMCKAMMNKCDLTKIDTMNADDSIKYLKAVHYAGDGRRPYDMMASPVPGGDELDVAGGAWFSHSVDNEYDNAMDWLEDHKEEVDMENQAESDPKKAEELRKKQEQKWQTKTQNIWNSVKQGASEAPGLLKKWAYKPIEGWGMILDGTASVAKGAWDAGKAAADKAATNIMGAKSADQTGISNEASLAAAQAAGRYKFPKRAWSNLKPPELDGLMQKYAAMYGVPLSHMRTTAFIESGGDPKAYSKSTAASTKGQPLAVGIYQFMPDTAYDKRIGLNVSGGPDNRWDMEKNVEAGAKYALIMKNALRKSLGREPEMWEIYGAHQQGEGGFPKLIKAAESGVTKEGANDIVMEIRKGKKITMRQALDQNGGVGLSPREFVDIWKQKYNYYAAQANGGSVPSQGVAVGNMPPPPTTASTTPAKIDPTKPAASPTPTVAKTSPATENAKPTTTASMKDNITKPVQHVSLQAPVQKPDTAVTREGTEQTSVRPANELVNTSAVSAAPVTADPRAVSNEGAVPVDVMAEKQKAEKEAALVAAEKRRQDALDTTSTGMDASVAILKEQLRIAISMDNSLSKIEQHLAKMATMSKQQPAPAAPAEKSSSQDMRMMTSGSPDNTPPPVSVSRRT